PAPPAGRRLRVQIVMFDEVEELDWAAPFEVFSAAARMGGPIDASLVALDGPREIVGSYGARGHRHQWLVATGGRHHCRARCGYQRPDMPGVEAEIKRGDLPRALAAAPRPGLTIASVCAGAMILSAAGLTRGPVVHHSSRRPSGSGGSGWSGDRRPGGRRW
ncbi:MAG: hypothetical protein ACRD0H_27770, partial [Actinomycetes bacterium]